MWASGVVKAQISADGSAGLGNGLVGVEVNFLVFDRPPEPFHEDIVPPIPPCRALRLKIVFQRQLADLGVQRFDIDGWTRWFRLRFIAENACRPSRSYSSQVTSLFSGSAASYCRNARSTA